MSRPPSSCPRCDAPILPSDRTCFVCGHVLEETVAPARPALADPGAQTAEREGRPVPVQPREAPPAPEERALQVAAAATEPPPWELRRQYGFWGALWLTWRDSMFKPVTFFRRMPARSGYGPAIGYTLLLTAIAIFFRFYWGTIETLLTGGLEEGVLLTILGGLAVLVLGGGFLLAMYLGMLFLIVGLIHVGFMIVGAGRMGYEATFRATAYASGPAAFAIFPFFGPLLSMVWGSVLLFIAVREAQRTTNGRATLAFLVPLIAAFLFFLFLGIVVAILVGTTDLGTAL